MKFSTLAEDRPVCPSPYLRPGPVRWGPGPHERKARGDYRTSGWPPMWVMCTDDTTAYRGVMSNPDPHAREPLTDEVLAEEIQLLGLCVRRLFIRIVVEIIPLMQSP